MVQTLAANRADHPLHASTLLRSWRSQYFLNAKLFHQCGTLVLSGCAGRKSPWTAPVLNGARGFRVGIGTNRYQTGERIGELSPGTRSWCQDAPQQIGWPHQTGGSS